MPVVADLDNDGNKEIVFGLESGLFKWNCDTRSLTTLLANTDTMYRYDCPVIAADIDNDGKKEILYGVVNKSRTQKPTMYLYAYKPAIRAYATGWGNNNHSLQLTGNNSLHYLWTTYFTVADIDNDGNIEVFLADNDTLKMWKHDGTPFGAGFIHIPGLDCRYVQPVIADIDGNNDCEIIIPSKDGNIYAYKSNGVQVNGWPIIVPELQTTPVVTDLDGDGLNEVIAAAQTKLYVWHTNGSCDLTPSSRFRYNQYNNAVYELPCTTYITPITIEGTQTWNDDRLVNRNITIENGSSLTIKCKTSFTDEASIIVKPSGKLIIDGGTLTSACPSEMWQGIQVWGNSSAPQTATNGVYQQGYVELKNDATIENAVCALDLWKPNDYTKTGGIVVATDANFINNAQSVRALHYIYTNGNNTEVNYNAHFTRCNFEVNDDYLGTETFYKHVGLNTVKGVEFRGCSFSVDRTASNIATYCMGIGAEDASFTATSHCNVPNTLPCPNGSMSVGTFSGFNSAIYASYTYTHRPFYVFDCEFNDNINGIYAINTGFAQILGNTFYVPSESICTFGVYLEGMSSFVVGSNDFIGVGSGCENCGVGVKNSPYDNIIEQNSFSNFAFGTESIGKNYNAIMVRPVYYVTLNYSCNNNSSNVLADFYAINDDSNIIGGVHNQGSSLQSAGNTFSNNTQHIANLTTYSFTYYYDTIYSGRKPTSTYGVNLSKTNNANDCGMGGGGSSSKSPLTDYEEAEDNCNSIAAALEAENDPNNIEVLEAELTQAEHQRLAIVGNAVRNMLMDSISDINEIRQWLNRANTPSADRAICATYLSQRDYETALDKAAAMIDKYEMEDDALIEQTEYISILKLQRKVETEGRVMEQLNGEELGQVQRLAENGTGVARSMAKAIMMMNGMAEAECDCNNELAEMIRGNEGTKADAITENAEEDVYYFNISPVPAKDYIIVSYNLPTDHATLTITNNLGMTVRTVNIEGKQGKKVVSLTEISAGVYACTIQGEGFTKTEKIVVTK